MAIQLCVHDILVINIAKKHLLKTGNDFFKEMFLQYYMHSDSRLKSHTIHVEQKSCDKKDNEYMKVT